MRHGVGRSPYSSSEVDLTRAVTMKEEAVSLDLHQFNLPSIEVGMNLFPRKDQARDAGYE